MKGSRRSGLWHRSAGTRHVKERIASARMGEQRARESKGREKRFFLTPARRSAPEVCRTLHLQLLLATILQYAAKPSGQATTRPFRSPSTGRLGTHREGADHRVRAQEGPADRSTMCKPDDKCVQPQPEAQHAARGTISTLIVSTTAVHEDPC